MQEWNRVHCRWSWTKLLFFAYSFTSKLRAISKSSFGILFWQRSKIVYLQYLQRKMLIWSVFLILSNADLNQQLPRKNERAFKGSQSKYKRLKHGFLNFVKLTLQPEETGIAVQIDKGDAYTCFNKLVFYDSWLPHAVKQLRCNVSDQTQWYVNSLWWHVFHAEFQCPKDENFARLTSISITELPFDKMCWQ